MIDTQSTTYISDEFSQMIHRILTPDELDRLSKIPAEEPAHNKTIEDNPHELNYVLAYVALAKSAKTPDEEAGQAFRYFAKLIIRKMSKKIARNRRLVLLHMATISTYFAQQNLPAFFIVLFEEDQSV
jgi:hypothetical protein